MANVAKIDENSRATLTALASDASGEIVTLFADKTTHRLLVDATGGTGTVTQVDTGTGLTGGPITTTGTVALSTALAPIATLTGNSLKTLRVNLAETAVEYATSGAGDVLGPATNTADYIPQWNGANSKTLKNGIDPATLLTTSTGLKLDQTSSQTIANGQPIQGTLTASELVSTDANRKLQSLAVATYPSLTELSYVKGVTSAVQTQINNISLDSLSDVTIATPVVDQFLRYNGADWVNGAGATSSAGPGIEFFNATPIFNTQNTPNGLSQDGTAGNGVVLNSLSKTPVISNTATVTITNATPAVITWTTHGLPKNAPVVFTTTGALPTGITAGTTYFISEAAGYTASSFRISTTVANSVAGVYVNTSSAGSGTHTGTSGEQTVTGAIASDTRAFASWLYNTALGRTSIDAGIWQFETYCGVNSIAAGRVTTLTRQIYQVQVPAFTVTVSGVGANSRTVTSSGGTPFAVGGYFAASATNTTASYIQTPSGLFQITARTSDTQVTITVPTGYANDAAGSAFTLWNKLLSATSSAITAISPSYALTSFSTTQAAFTVALTDKLGAISFGTSNNTTTITLTYNGNSRNTHFTTPLVTMHNNLAGLQGGVANEYYHLTFAEYTGTGTDVFVRKTAPTFVTSLASPSVLATANDSGALGASGTAFSDLFLASGGVINWAAGNATLTHSTGLLTYNVPVSIGTSNAFTVGTIELGAATDSTIARSAAAVINVEGEILNGFTSTATAAGTTTMDNTYTKIQQFTGTTTQTVKLPTTGIVKGQQYEIQNIGTSNAAVVTVQSSGANEILILGYGCTGIFTSTQATPTTAAHWTFQKLGRNIKTATSYTTDTGTSLNCDYFDDFIVTAQAGALLFNNPTGTAKDGQTLVIAVTGTAARALTYGNQFEASTVALPATTVTTARLNIGFKWRADTSKWVCVASC